jgi:NIPSNAP protein
VATQLRDYRITDGSLDQFVAAWQRHLAPLRRELGFTISGAWTVDGESRFVWLLTYPGDWDAFEEADRRYFASPQRAALDPDPARLIEDQRNVRLTEVELG